MPTRYFHITLLIILYIPLTMAEMTEHVDQYGVTYFSPEQSAQEVIMYGVPDCGFCRQARRYFEDQGISYIEYNINKSSKRRKEFRRLGGRGTPLILIDGRKIWGFKPQAIEAALN